MASVATFPLHHAVALGLLQGPTELLPVSSSAHTTFVPWLAGWPYSELDPRSRKSFEVALHAGATAALLVRPPVRRLGARPTFMAGALFPPALSGYALGGQIERRLGTPATIVAGMLAGSLATLVGELRARERCVESRGAEADAHSHNRRSAADACPRDGLALGLAQALALMPGVSRSGATLATARARGFSTRDADLLSWRVGLPVIAGATLLQTSRVAREGLERGTALPLAAGAASAFASTLLSTRIFHCERRAALTPACAVYRAALAALAIRRMRDRKPHPDGRGPATSSRGA